MCLKATTTTFSVFVRLSFIICYHELPLSSTSHMANTVAILFSDLNVALGIAIKNVLCDEVVLFYQTAKSESS